MPDGRDLLHEWQDAMQGIASAAKGAAGRTEIPRALLGPMERQVELLQELVERERRVQGEVVGQLLAPLDAVFDLLEQSGSALHQQAAALEEASRALGETAGLMKLQAEAFERTIKVMREPAKLAKAAAGVPSKGTGKGKAAAKGDGRKKKKSGS
jgi:methyl-accepting chemotaxis protein